MARHDDDFTWDNEPIADGDDIVRDYEKGHRSKEEVREDAASDIALTVSGGGFVADESYDDEGFNAQNNP